MNPHIETDVADRSCGNGEEGNSRGGASTFFGDAHKAHHAHGRT